MALNNNRLKRVLMGTGALALAGLLSPAALATDAQEIIRDRCLACHTESSDAANSTFSRISDQRKTPEGWHMTLNRMEHLRDAKISAQEKRELIKYLSDTQGLAPEEAAPFRYLLEQDTNLVESGVDENLMQMCARCHSAARFGLQRRTLDEWQMLVDFHMAQFPGIELHAGSRDRPWYQLAHNETSAQLSEQYPLDTPEWNNWSKAKKVDLKGRWRVTGYVPGKGEFSAWMTAATDDDGRYNLKLEGNYADGAVIEGSGKATVYTGYEWRGTLTIDSVKMRQVMAADKDGQVMAGRMFLAMEDEIGGELRAVKDTGKAQVVAVMPSYLKAGESAELVIVGQNLDGDIDLGDGVRIDEVIARSKDRIVVTATATGTPAVNDVQVGSADSTVALAVFDQVARVDVTPTNAVTRIGGNGGEMEKVRATYRAIGYSAGADGEAGTDDDVRLGYMPASWSIEPVDEVAEHDKDHLYAGEITPAGMFIPGDAGPNPERKMSANNVGRLNVVATVDDGDSKVEGRGSMLVSVPDFVERVLD
ncbi:quinohemoprotein amine dehydrogenase subunit alpha [Vreelandella rituensis]|uniref:Quinohemoprotein amine dehydrogenase subunit alpha n=1 Tax=Vreelandella rituensis TaxID=2282306 RepID=A0A368TRK2_9GAMM|nr:quinohemoprotein amine dehydrogenase subunit alpha [Halomonas rituensis]RCV87241.1 quinohemoprotein amine dehydrogenase subunit alpha [Halomonas rituensis]